MDAILLVLAFQTPCKVLHPEARYTDASAAWVLIASIIVFFMVSFKAICELVN